MSKLGEILVKLREERGLTQGQLGELSGVGQPTIQKLESGALKGTTKLVRLAMALNVSPIYLETLDSQYSKLTAFDTPKKHDYEEDDTYFPIVNVSASMGGGLLPPSHEEVVDVIKVSKTWVKTEIPSISSLQNLMIISGIGDSMEPTFKSGDLLIVDKGVSSIISNSAIYVFSFNEHLFIKRLSVNPITEVIHVKSDNQYADNWDVDKTHQDLLVIHGRVVYCWNGKRL